VCRQHFTVRIDVYALAGSLLQKQFHIVQVMAADHDKRAFFDSKRHFGRYRLTIGRSVGIVKQCHTFIVDLTGIEYKV